MFDTSFMEQTTSEVLDTERPRSEPGEYQANVLEINVRDFYSERKEKTYVVMDIFWDVDDPKVKALLDSDSNRIRQTVFLDMNDSGTGLDFSKGKNTGLGKVRDAVGQNIPGQPWSPTMLIGGRATVRVEQDENGYTNVTGCTKAAV